MVADLPPDGLALDGHHVRIHGAGPAGGGRRRTRRSTRGPWGRRDRAVPGTVRGRPRGASGGRTHVDRVHHARGRERHSRLDGGPDRPGRGCRGPGRPAGRRAGDVGRAVALVGPAGARRGRCARRVGDPLRHRSGVRPVAPLRRIDLEPGRGAGAHGARWTPHAADGARAECVRATRQRGPPAGARDGPAVRSRRGVTVVTRHGRAPRRPPLEVLEQGLRVVRMIASILLIGSAATTRGTDALNPSVTWSATIAALLLLLFTSIVDRRFGRRRPETAPVRLDPAALALGADAAAALVVVMVLRPGSTSFAWAVLLLPVLEAALRYRVVGAVLTWAALVAALLVRHAFDWDATYSLAEMQLEIRPMALLLVVGLPFAYLAEQLVAEVERQRALRSEAQTRVDHLTVLLTVNQSLSEPGPDGRPAEIVRATRALGFDAADVWAVDDDNTWTRLASGPGDAPALSHRPEGNEFDALPGARSTQVPVREPVPGAGTTTLCPLPQRGGRPGMLRAWSAEAGNVPTLRRQAVEALARQAAMALSLADLVNELELRSATLATERDHDALTGLLNRRGLMALIGHELAACSPGEAVGVILLDLDRFKQVNDRRGHQTGDRLLQGFAAALADWVPEGTTAGRLGGDEFVVLVPARAAARGDVVAFTAAVARRITERFVVPVEDLTARASAGFATSTADDTPSTILHRADKSMYSTKQARHGESGRARAAAPDVSRRHAPARLAPHDEGHLEACSGGTTPRGTCD